MWLLRYSGFDDFKSTIIRELKKKYHSSKDKEKLEKYIKRTKNYTSWRDIRFNDKGVLVFPDEKWIQMLQNYIG